MVQFTNLKREEIFSRLTSKPLDVFIIGGGITGAGIALDAVTRGMRTGLVDMQDFAAGTSSRSTKLVHGGLRYLKQLEIKLVAEVGKERAIVYENGPHVTTPEWMMLPFHKGGTFGPLSTSMGLRMYDYLAGVKRTERRTILSPKEAVEREPLIKREGLRGAGKYVEYKTDDARLTLEVLKKAVEKGATAVNYTKVTDFIYDKDGKLTGAIVEDITDGRQLEIYAKKIINAAGPWVDNLREKDGSKNGKELFLTKGIHLVFDHKRFPLQQAIYFDSPDGRMIFAIPREGKTYVGTTDTQYEGDLTFPKVTVRDCEYILHAINDMFPSVELEVKDMESSWAGVRPLIGEEGKSPSEVSRKDEIFISESGLFSMAGGKLTGYRKMAENVIDLIVDQFKQEEKILYSESETKYLPIAGGEIGGSVNYSTFRKRKIEEGMALGIPEKEAVLLTDRYGANIERIYERYHLIESENEYPEMDPLVLAQLQYGIEEELVYRPEDFFVRRTGALYFRIDWVREHKQSVIEYMSKVFNWDFEEQDTYSVDLDRLLYYAVTPVD